MTGLSRRLAISVFFCTVSSLQAQSEIQVLYTGRLLGYARTPDVQHLRFKKMNSANKTPLFEAVPDSTANPVAAALQRLLNDARGTVLAGATKLTLGSGDSFAVEFGSRSVLIDDYFDPAANKVPAHFVAKDELAFDRGEKLWFWIRGADDSQFKSNQTAEESGMSQIDTDNVAAFLAAGGYDAIVPGSHDFHFGPERVRQLARLLVSGERKVQMLAANLTIQSQFAKPKTPKSDAQRDSGRKYALLTPPATEMQFALPKTVLPWIRNFVLKNAYAGAQALFAHPRICEAPDDDRDKLGPCDDLTARQVPDPRSKKGSALFSVNGAVPLKAETAYQLCFDDALGKTALPFCSLIDVVSPFFQYPDERKLNFTGGRSMKTSYTRTLNLPVPEPYLKKDNVVVMGVVAPAFEKTVGLLNSRWLNSDQAVDTGVVAVDPAESLVQMTDFCIARQDCDESTTFILLAHMPRDAAALLSRRLTRRAGGRSAKLQMIQSQSQQQFSLVISQTDSSFMTAREEVVYPQGHPALTVVPGEMYDRDAKQFQPTVQKVTLEGSLGNWKATTASLRSASGISVGGNFDCLSPAVSNQWSRIAGAPPNTPFNEQFQWVTLDAMRRNADVAIIQRRDFFGLDNTNNCYAATPGPLQAAEAIERILWKGDMVMTQTITGAALKAILKQSAAFDKADADPYTDNLHPGQGLLVLGALQNPETKSWYVNGQDVSDGRLYAVALTDFLAFGDTGYPDLATPPVPPAFRLNNAGDNGRATRITDLVAARVLGSKSTPPSLDISTYADHLKHNPFTQGPPATFFDKVGIMRRNAKKPEWKKDTAGALAEERAYWRLFVDKGELAFNRYENNYPFLGKLKSAFNGIPESGVTTPQSRSWSNALALELRREKRNRTWFARFEEEYARAFTQQSSPAGSYLLSYTSNRLGGEAGIRQTFSGTVRQGRWIGWVASFNATSQVVRPLDSESIALAKDGCPSLDPKVVCSVSFQTNLARTSRMLGKVGLRAETRTSWFEFGYFGGEVNRATRYHLINGSQDVSDCPPWDFSQCIGKPNTVPDGTSGSALRFQASSAAKPETGLFFNFNAALPIPKGYVVDAFTFDNRGMWFSNHDKDMQIDSRVSEKITFGAKIAIPALPNLSLMPSVAIFWYANKMKDELLFARTFDIKLDYRFDKATGTRWSRVLGFGRPK